MLQFPHGESIPTGSSVALAGGIQWLRLPLPFGIDHINVWAVPDEAGWALVDAGALFAPSQAAWERYEAEVLGTRPVRQLLVTHWHPDHSGAAGWLQRRHRCAFAMTRLEYAAACHRTAVEPVLNAAQRQFYVAAGWVAEQIAGIEARLARFGAYVGIMPERFDPLEHEGSWTTGERPWTVRVGSGHSPEHACLVSEDLKVMIAGDQVLPRISTNVSVLPDSPAANPLSDWMSSLAELRAKVDPDVLVLPAHGAPFHGLHERIDQLLAGHERGLATMLDRLLSPGRVIDMHAVLFGREIGPELFWLATGEALAHLNCLMARGQVGRELAPDGVAWYRRT